MSIIISKSKIKGKKWTAFINGKRVHFGASGYSDYTLHKDPKRKKRYIARHEKREDWTHAGRYTPGYWSRWLLWHKPGLRMSADSIEKKLGQKITINLTGQLL